VIPRAYLVGLGPIGIEVGRALRARGIPLAGAADPTYAGQPLGQLIGDGDAGAIAASAGELYARRVDGELSVAVLCTGSRVPQVAPQIEEALAAGLHVVSTCEELSYPRLRHAELAARLDDAARAAGRAVLGTGINPGFVMDRLPWTLAQACVRVEHVHVERVVDAARRRGPLRAKVGAGLSVEQFLEGVARGALGHVGLGESAARLAAELGFALDEVEETLAPVVGEGGVVKGVQQAAWVRSGGRERVRLELVMAVGAPDPHDRIVVDGDPPLDVLVQGGAHGDRGTVGTVVSAVAGVASLPVGVVTSYR
jgi:4-hydroxy-tetrahydrodipicolinate reductase